MFEIGHRVSLPGHGECVIKSVLNKKWSKDQEILYVLKPKNARFSLQRVVISHNELMNHKINQE